MLDISPVYPMPTVTVDRAPPRAIDGRSYGHLTKSQRAALAADVLEGRLSLRLTATAISKVVGVSVPYITAASRLSPMERAMVRRGWSTLREVTTPSAETRFIEAAHEVGIDRALEMLAVAEAA